MKTINESSPKNIALALLLVIANALLLILISKRKIEKISYLPSIEKDFHQLIELNTLDFSPQSKDKKSYKAYNIEKTEREYKEKTKSIRKRFAEQQMVL